MAEETRKPEDQKQEESKEQYDDPSLVDLEEVAGGADDDNCFTGGNCSSAAIT